MNLNQLNQTDIENVVIYFSDGRRLEFADIMQATISSRCEWGQRGIDFNIELNSAMCIEHTKRTSKRYKKNRRGYK